MTSDLTYRDSKDGYDFLEAGRVVGRLVWVPSPSARAPAGWWLEIPGEPEKDKLIYMASEQQMPDLERARRESMSACLFFAEEILSRSPSERA